MIEKVPSDFRCLRCGNCCSVRGTVGVNPEEVEGIASYLRLPVEGFTERFTVLNDNRAGLILKDHDDGSCIFLRPDRTCEINPVKPGQCKNFPWGWNYREWTKVCSFNYRPGLQER